MKAIVLAGGKGVRLLPYTAYIPKPLVPIKEKPILDIVLRQLISYDFKDIIISVGYLAGLIKAYFDNSDIKKDIRLRYVHEKKPLGTAGSLSLLKNVKNTFLVMNGDVLTTLNYNKLIEFHKASKSVLTVATHRESIKIDSGVIEVDNDRFLKKYTEKPTYDFEVSMGIYICESRVLNYIPSGAYLDFPSLINRLLGLNERVASFPFDGYWLDIGKHADYARAQEEFDKIKDSLFASGHKRRRN